MKTEAGWPPKGDHLHCQVTLKPTHSFLVSESIAGILVRC